MGLAKFLMEPFFFWAMLVPLLDSSGGGIQVAGDAVRWQQGAEPTRGNQLHSIVFVTKRPGGYDVLLEALARQTRKDYELICVDELADSRRSKVEAMAEELGVNLVAITLSKYKTHPHTRFGIANAINTGFILSSGSIVTILQDNIYLPPDFVERTLAFHRDQPLSLLSYPEARFAAPPGLLLSSALRDASALSVFSQSVSDGPLKEGWEMQREGSMPLELWENMQKGERIAFDWLECACCSVPWEVLKQLNGVDETLDTGDDCHEVNLKQRSQMFGSDVWNEGGCPVQIIDHHRWERSDLWTRFTRDTNIFRWSFIKQQMEFGEYPLRAPNNFDLSVMRRPEPSRIQEVEREQDGENFLLEIRSPLQGQAIDSPFITVSFSVYPSRLPVGAHVCVCIGQDPASSSCSHASSGDIVIAVHGGVVQVVRLIMYSSDGRLMSEAQVGIVQRVTVSTGELARLAEALGAASGRVKGYSNSVRSGLEIDAIQEVFRKEHDHPKESLLFVYNKDPVHVETWRDGLWAALRIIARYYDIQYLNVHDIVVEEQPEVAYHIIPGTYKLILGWGAFGSPTDYFLNYIHTKHGDRHPKALCIGGNAQPPPKSAADVYDILFYETEWYKDEIAFHPMTRQAFGINSNIYHEVPPRLDYHGQPIFDYDVLVVGHFLPWKRHYLMLDKPGRKIAVGEFYEQYESSQEIATKLQDGGVEVTNMLPPRDLANLYRNSRLVYFPMAEVGGGERAVLEARACGCQVEIAPDNSKLQSLSQLDPIPSHETYAHQLLEGITDMLEKRGTANVTTRPPMPSNETVAEQRRKELVRQMCKGGGYCPYAEPSGKELPEV